MMLCFASGVTEMAYARSKPKRYDQRGEGTYPDKPILTTVTKGYGGNRHQRKRAPTVLRGENKVKSGPGSQRKGHTYIVKRDTQTGAYYHVYGRGKGARRVKLHKDVANSYGYPAQG